MIFNGLYCEKIEGKKGFNFVLIHNAGGNHQFFTYQISKLLNYGNVILLDLPGHGASDKKLNNSIDDSSIIIHDICQHFSLTNICIIGLNKGSDIAINTLCLYKLPITKMILIDPPLLMEDVFIAEINEFINKLEEDGYEEFVHSLVDNLFIRTNEDNKQIAFNAFMQVHKPSLQKIFQSLITWDENTENLLELVTVPTLCILTDEHHCTYDKIKQTAPNFTLGKVIGSKCWATLEVPDQVNAMIERFLIV